MKFYCTWYCPFAQRAWMTLLHRKLDFEYLQVARYATAQGLHQTHSVVSMAIETNHPLVEEIFSDWRTRIGDDFAGYRGHADYLSQTGVHPDMIAHTTLHVSDYEKSKAFYAQALALLGESLQIC